MTELSSENYSFISLTDFLYIIEVIYDCDDPYYPPYKKIYKIFRSIEEAFSQLVVTLSEDLNKRYGREFILTKYLIDEIGKKNITEILFDSKFEKLQKNEFGAILVIKKTADEIDEKYKR